jgi:hypothetical protein
MGDEETARDGATVEMAKRRAERAHERLDDHAETHQQFDRRISTNENYRLQAMGALKILAILLGTGLVGYLLEIVGFL